MTHSPMSQNRVRDALEPQLWCMHIAGPNEWRPAPDFWTALGWSAELNASIAKKAIAQDWASDDNWPFTQATVQRWHWSAEEHAARLARELAERADHEARRVALTAPPASDAADAEGLADTWLVDFLREAFDEGANAASTYDRNPKEKRWSDYANEVFNAFWLEEQDRLAAAPTAPAQAPSRPVDAGGVEAAAAAMHAQLQKQSRAEPTSWEELCARSPSAADRYRGMASAALATQAPDKASRPVGGETAPLVKASEVAHHAHGLELAAQVLDKLAKPATASTCANAAAYFRGLIGSNTRRMVEGCCSAVSPCSHQRRDPYSLCEVCTNAATPTPPQADKPPIADVLAAVQDRNRIDPGHDARVTDYAAIEAMGEDGAAQ